MSSNIGPVSFQGKVTQRDPPCASVNELLAELRQVYKECLAEVGNSGWTTQNPDLMSTGHVYYTNTY